MADLFPTDPRRIRDRLRRYERALQRELDTGDGRDGYGKRYVLGPLYMLLGDVDGALASFDWYVDAFPDDGGEPYQYLTWALALFRGGRRPEAVRTLCHTMLQNVYLVPFVLGHHPRRLDIWHGSNWEWPEYAAEIPQALLQFMGRRRPPVGPRSLGAPNRHHQGCALCRDPAAVERRAPRATTHGPRTRVVALRTAPMR